jgi:hypothetical protein
MIESVWALHEQIEHRVEHLLRDAIPIVFDADHRLLGFLSDPERHFAATVGVLGRVAEQVDLDLLDCVSLASALDRSRRADRTGS